MIFIIIEDSLSGGRWNCWIKRDKLNARISSLEVPFDFCKFLIAFDFPCGEFAAQEIDRINSP